MRFVPLLLCLLLLGCSPNAPQFKASDALDLFLVLIVLPGCIIAGCFGLMIFLGMAPIWAEQAVKEKEKSELQRQEQERLDDLRDVPPHLSEEEFRRDIIAAYHERLSGKILIPEYLDQVVEVVCKIYVNDFKLPQKLPSLQDPFEAYDLIFKAILYLTNPAPRPRFAPSKGCGHGQRIEPSVFPRRGGGV